MYDSWKMCVVMWMDQKLVLLLSTSKVPLSFPCEVVQVPRRVGQHVYQIPTSPVHLEYTMYMQGVDVADQLRGSYSCQVRSHKWWHHLFYFLIDTTVVNMWILHKEFLARNRHEKESLIHFKFIVALCKALTRNWAGQKASISLVCEDMPHIHCPQKSHLCQLCVVYKKRTNFYCVLCSFQWMCYTCGCYMKMHHPSGTF